MRDLEFPSSQQRLLLKLQRNYWSGAHTKKIVKSLNTLPLICFKNWIAASCLAAAVLNVDESSCGSTCFKYVLQLNFSQSGPVFCRVVLASLRLCIFYQFVVNSVFNTLLKEHHQIDIPEEDDIEASLNYEEKNALQYTAGYVTSGLIKKLKCLCNPRKKQLITYLIEMNTDKELPGLAKDESEDWVDFVDRGGLTHTGSMMFGVFGSMELEVRRFLARNPSQVGKIKEELCKRIVSDEDVLFYWAIVLAGWEVEDSRLLLEHIIEYYVTISGFSFASGWIIVNHFFVKCLVNFMHAHCKLIQ